MKTTTNQPQHKTDDSKWRPVYTRVLIAGVSYIFLLWLFTTWWS